MPVALISTQPLVDAADALWTAMPLYVTTALDTPEAVTWRICHLHRECALPKPEVAELVEVAVPVDVVEVTGLLVELCVV